MAFDPSFLTSIGFMEDPELRLALSQEAIDKNLDRGGPYRLLAALRKGLITVVVEQNVTTEVLGGLSTQITYPEVAKVTGPGGSTACAAEDQNLVLAMTEAMA